MRTLVRGRAGQPTRVSEIMSHPVQVAQVTQHAMDLVPLFSHSGHHHIPIVDPDDRLVGVITQTDLVRTLAAAVQGRGDDGAPVGAAGRAGAAAVGPAATHAQQVTSRYN